MQDKEKHIDEMIAKYAIDANWDRKTSLERSVVRNLFALAFPPENLHKILSFVSTEEYIVDFDEIIEKYSPYYTSVVNEEH